MIDFRLSLTNPFQRLIKRKPWYQKDYVVWEPSVSKNWGFSFQLSKSGIGHILFSIVIDLEWYGKDHAGPQLELEFLGWYLHAHLYNTNHWHYDKGRWMTLEEMKADLLWNPDEGSSSEGDLPGSGNDHSS